MAVGEGFTREEVRAGLEVVGGTPRSKQVLIHWWGGLRPLSQGSRNSNRLQAPRGSVGYMLRDSATSWQEALTPGFCSQAFGGSFVLGSPALEAVSQGSCHLGSPGASDSSMPCGISWGQLCQRRSRQTRTLADSHLERTGM